MVVLCWLEYHCSSEIQCEIIFFISVIRSGTRPLWCASFTRMSFIEIPFKFASAKLLIEEGILSAVLDLQNCISFQEPLCWLHWCVVQKTLALLVLSFCLLAALAPQYVVSLRDGVYIHVIPCQATSDISHSCGWISSSCQLGFGNSNCCLGVLSWLSCPYNALLSTKHATLMAKTTCLTNSELLPSREWISLNSHWRCQARNCRLAKAICVLLWEAKLTAMNRCGEKLVSDPPNRALFYWLVVSSRPNRLSERFRIHTG